MVPTTVDHFYAMGKYSSQLFVSQKPFLLAFASRQIMTLLYGSIQTMLEIMYLRSVLAFFYERALTL